MSVKPKKKGLGLEMRTFKDKSGTTYLVFRSRNGSFHVFQEVEAKEAAKKCGAKRRGSTRQMWQEVWKKKS